MNTQFWGPSGWQFLHTLANIYPVKPSMIEKMMMRDFMGLVADVLPCKYCRDNLKNNLKKIPLKKGVFKSRDTL